MWRVHPRERKFAPLTHVVLMAFDVLPDERKRKTPSDFDDFVHCVVFKFDKKRNLWPNNNWRNY
jgi:hypothetical protein